MSRLGADVLCKKWKWKALSENHVPAGDLGPEQPGPGELARMLLSLELVSILHQVDGSGAALHVWSLICLVCGICLSASLTVSQIACVVRGWSYWRHGILDSFGGFSTFPRDAKLNPFARLR